MFWLRFVPLQHSVQQFQRTCDETKAWIAEKEQVLATDDCGKDLDSVKHLQRKHQVKKGKVHY